MILPIERFLTKRSYRGLLPPHRTVRAAGILMVALALGLVFQGAAAGLTPVPQISQPLVPSSVVPGGPSLTLTVNGTGFVATSAVNWNGAARVTTFVSNTQLTATILAADTASATTASVTVTNLGPPPTISNAVFLTVTNVTSQVTLGKLDFATGVAPQSIAVGDFNGDGKLDLAVANISSNTVSILLGNGDGTFQPQTTFATGSGPQGLIAADFNNDGKLDLAVANSSANTVSILLGNGDGTFRPKMDFLAGLAPSSVATADFDGDGKLDLAITNSVSNTVSILLGNGDGTFVTKSTPATGTAPSSVAVGDFNGDGIPDLAVTDRTSNRVSTLLGNGDGTFKLHVDHPVSSNPATVAVADVNNDGRLDLAVANQGSNTISILLGNGDGTFQAPLPQTTGRGPSLVLTGDFNGDGRLDLAVSNTTGSTVSILLGNGDGTFQPHQDSATGATPVGIAAADFNGDGRLDLASAGSSASTVSVMLQVPGVAFSSPALGFGSQRVGTTSAAQSTNLTNSGSAQLILTSIAVTGTNSEDFAQSNTCIIAPATTATLAPGASCTISVTFAPTAIGGRTAAVTVTDNAGDSPQSVILTGAGTTPAVRLSIPSLNFISLDVGQTSVAQTVTLTNTGSATLNFTAIGVTGDFAQSSSCLGPPASLAPGQSCSISVTFRPTAAGSRTGTVTISDDASSSPQTITLTGLGVQPAATLTPATGLTFTDQLLSTTSASQAVTLDNSSGTGPLLITSIVASGDFAQTNNCGLSVGAGAHCVITVTFTPTAVGARSGLVTITDNNNGVNGTTQTIALSGNGIAPAVSLSVTALPFGSQPAGTTSAVQMVTLNNTGAGPLTVASIAISGANAGDFAESNACIPTVAAGASCIISVTYTPSARGLRSATITITDNDGGVAGKKQTIALTGTGIGPSVAVAPASLTFASQTVNTSSAAQTVTLTNSGESADAISAVSISTSTPPAFAIQTDTCMPSLAAGASCAINVTFTPKSGGSFAGTLTITDTASPRAPSVSLAGVGADYGLSVTPPSANITAGQLAEFSVQLTPAGGFNQPVTLSCAGLPQLANCVFIPSTATLDGVNPVTLSLSVTTNAHANPGPPVITFLRPDSWTRHFGLPAKLRSTATAPLLGLCLLALATLAGFTAAGRRLGGRGFSLSLLGVLLGATLVLPACGGNGTLTPLSPPGGTPSGTYTVTVSAAGGSLSHSTTVTLTVK